MSRIIKLAAVICLLVTYSALLLHSSVNSQSTTVTAPKELRAARNTYTPVMDVLNPARTRVTDEQLQRLRSLPIEAVWGAIQGKGYKQCFVNNFRMTQPDVKMVGRALTMRYLPVRPDLQQAIETLAKEGNWDYQYNVRAGDDTAPGDVIVVELGGAADRAPCWRSRVGKSAGWRSTTERTKEMMNAES